MTSVPQVNAATRQEAPLASSILAYGKALVSDPTALLSREELVPALEYEFGPGRLNNVVRRHEDRHAFIARFSFAVPCREAIEAIAGYSSRVLEIGAGTGFWAHILRAHGLNVLATDRATKRNSYKQKIGAYWAVRKLEATRAVNSFAGRDVLCIWPSYDHPWAFKALRFVLPERLIFYIGEGEGGCTGCDRFHTFLEDRCRLLAEVELPNFYGIDDTLMIYRVLEGKTHD